MDIFGDAIMLINVQTWELDVGLTSKENDWVFHWEGQYLLRIWLDGCV